MNGKNRATELLERFASGGEATIDRFIEEQISEELFIDYKRVTNDGANPKLEQSDRETFARAIGGFGNSEGGIIIWGVDCRNDRERGDVPTTKHPILKVKRFLSYLEGATSGCTLPLHDDVRHCLIERPGSDEGFIVTLISKSMFAPHQCIVGKHKGRYHVRVGSNFEQASHGLLAGMFGKRPAPYIFHMWQLSGGVSPQTYAPVVSHLPTSTPYAFGRFILRNHGNTVARDLYVNYSFVLPGPNCMLHAPNLLDWTHNESMQPWHHIIAPDAHRLPPAGMVIPVDFRMFLKPPFEQRLWFEISFGCEGSQLSRLVKAISIDDLKVAYSSFVGSDGGREARHKLARAVFGADEGTEEYAEAFD
jgi:hypothetical protein